MGKTYDYLIVGAGLYGAVAAYELKKKGFKCLVIDKKAISEATSIRRMPTG